MHFTFIPVSAAQEGAVVEHVLEVRVDAPVVALGARSSAQLNEAVVERQVVPD